MAIPDGIYSNVSHGAVAEDAMQSFGTQPAAVSLTDPLEHIPQIYRSIELDFWAELSADQAEAVRRMQQIYVEHTLSTVEAAEKEKVAVDDQLLALASPRLISGGFMMGGGFFATLLSMLDILGPGMLWFGLPIALLGLLLSLDSRN